MGRGSRRIIATSRGCIAHSPNHALQWHCFAYFCAHLRASASNDGAAQPRDASDTGPNSSGRRVGAEGGHTARGVRGHGGQRGENLPKWFAHRTPEPQFAPLTRRRPRGSWRRYCLWPNPCYIPWRNFCVDCLTVCRF